MAALVRRVATIVALVAAGVWLGGLVALGAIAAPVVFAIVSMPAAADAMTIVFRRFDLVAMSCAALVLASEAARAVARIPFARVDRARVAVSVVAAAAAVVEGAFLSPRIASLHASGAVRGLGEAGASLARFHDYAEWCGKAEVVLVVAIVVLHVVSADAKARD